MTDIDNFKDQAHRNINIRKLTLRFEYLSLLSFYKLVNNLVPIIDIGLLQDKLNSETWLTKRCGFRQSNDNFRFAMYGQFWCQKLERSPKPYQPNSTFNPLETTTNYIGTIAMVQSTGANNIGRD